MLPVLHGFVISLSSILVCSLCGPTAWTMPHVAVSLSFRLAHGVHTENSLGRAFVQSSPLKGIEFRIFLATVFWTQIEITGQLVGKKKSLNGK